MTTKQIEYIIELAKTLNFNRAAENLFISQPTLTYQIKVVEEEIGFILFDRSGKSVKLTPAGTQFVATLQSINETLKEAIEQGQNFSAQYEDTIRISLPNRTALYFLPQAIIEFNKCYPKVYVSLYFDSKNYQEFFLQNEAHLVFAMEHQMAGVPLINTHHLFDSKFYLITRLEDPLVAKKLVQTQDLKGRTLMVGGGSPPVLKALQQELIHTVELQYFNSHDHETTLTKVAAGQGVCIAPGFLNDHNKEFAWLPFATNKVIPCAIYSHKYDNNKYTKEFISILTDIYQEQRDFAY